jgi:glycosyltransferase involved in cell wall biosynthesis
MTAVHQLVHAALPHDAVTDQAFHWRRLLRGWGLESEIFAEYVHSDLLADAHPLDRAGRRLANERGLVLHYAGWSPTAEAALEASGPLAVYYHNITPGDLLRDFSEFSANLCDRGRAALPLFKGKTDALLAASEYSASELREAGLGDVTVLPLMLDLPSEVPRREPNLEPVVLTVGRIVPNKRLEDVIKAFALYQQHRAPEASLLIVGADSGFENYCRALELLVAQVGAEDVVFTGPISAEDRDGWYERADAFLSMSVHEGFCLPLIEALAHGVPVVARDAGAMPETLGGAGIVVDGGDLALVAEALHELASSPSTRRLLYDAADARLRELRPEALAAQLRSALTPLL